MDDKNIQLLNNVIQDNKVTFLIVLKIIFINFNIFAKKQYERK